jgi:F-type H+-transporting ATPase subunit b
MMFYLTLFAPFQPTPGLAIWSAIIFILFWVIFGKFAFKPIVQGLEARENDIQSALDEAKKAKEEMANLKSENEVLLQQAREERAAMLVEAKETKNSIISEAKDKAKAEANKIIVDAKSEIENQKKAALAEVKSEVGVMALQIAEKIMKKDLQGDSNQIDLVNKLVAEVNQN